MINVDFLNIDNAKLVGRLLPFWARGKNISLLLQAVLSPIISVHNNFKLWALERYIYTHITSQAMSIEWYLKYKLKSHFVNERNSFIVKDEPLTVIPDQWWDDDEEEEGGETGGEGGGSDIEWEEGVIDIYSCFGGETWINEFDWKNNAIWSGLSAYEPVATFEMEHNEDGIVEPEDEEQEDETEEEEGPFIYVYAPAIVSTINYNQDDYIRDINYIVSQFMTNFKKIKIIIINKQ